MADASGLANEEQINSVASGSGYSAEQLDPQTGEKVKNLLTPIQIGSTTTPWSTGLVVSMSEILAPSNQTTYMLIIMLISALVAIGMIMAIIIKQNVSKPLKTTAGFAKSLADGNLDEKIEIKSMDEIGQLGSILDQQVRDAFKNIVYAQALAQKQSDYQKEQVEKLVLNLKKLSDGDLDCDTSVTEPDEDTKQLYDVYSGINASFETSIKAIKALVADADMLSKAAIEGKLSIRAEAEKHKGDFKKIVDGVNNTLDAVIHPVNETAIVLGEMSKGNLNVMVTGEYQGDHAILKDALNGTLTEIRGYITEIAQVLGGISDGDVTANITSEYKGDFKELKNSINKIIASLNEILSEINTAADQVASGSAQVSLGNQAISQGATEQASSIEELTASIAQIAEQTNLNAENSNKSNEMAAEMKKAAIEGNEQMKSMLLSMDAINESSEKISNIIKVIEDIAFQTNILALNAAVEAARAGVHGKGFAVVAEEVRNLAARSANAAKETTELIEGSIKKVGNGTKIAQETAAALNNIVTSVEETVVLGEKIAVASKEQASGIGQINQGLEQLSQVVQTNSASAQEGAAASQELSGQAELLKEKIGEFKLKDQKISKQKTSEEDYADDFTSDKY
jgi:methyl-accepting chemotaxis protein